MDVDRDLHFDSNRIRNIIVVDNIVNAARCVNKQAVITAHLSPVVARFIYDWRDWLHTRISTRIQIDSPPTRVRDDCVRNSIYRVHTYTRVRAFRHFYTNISRLVSSRIVASPRRAMQGCVRSARLFE